MCIRSENVLLTKNYKKMKKIEILYAFLLILITFSCGKDNDDVISNKETVLTPAAPSESPTEAKNLKEVAHFTQNNHKISVKTINGKLFSGYNDIYFEITNEKDETISAEKVSFLPMMRMYKNGNPNEIGHSHSCPHTSDLQRVSNGMYRGYAIFQMHTGSTGHWDFSLTYSANNQEVTAKEMQIEITQQPQESHLKFTRFRGKDEKMYILALISPISHKNGRNEGVIAGLFRAESMVSFPLVKDFSLELDPRMPGDDMHNHSTPFDNFAIQGDGFHKANINYSMSGYWILNFIVKNAQKEMIAGSEVPKMPKTKEDFNAKSSVYLEIDIKQ